MEPFGIRLKTVYSSTRYVTTTYSTASYTHFLVTTNNPYVNWYKSRPISRWGSGSNQLILDGNRIKLSTWLHMTPEQQLARFTEEDINQFTEAEDETDNDQEQVDDLDAE